MEKKYKNKKYLSKKRALIEYKVENSQLINYLIKSNYYDFLEHELFVKKQKTKKTTLKDYLIYRIYYG